MLLETFNQTGALYPINMAPQAIKATPVLEKFFYANMPKRSYH